MSAAILAFLMTTATYAGNLDLHCPGSVDLDCVNVQDTAGRAIKDHTGKMTFCVAKASAWALYDAGRIARDEFGQVCWELHPLDPKYTKPAGVDT